MKLLTVRERVRVREGEDEKERERERERESTYPVWSDEFWLTEPKPQKGAHCATIEDPGSEAEVVDQSFKAAGIWQQHNPSNHAL